MSIISGSNIVKVNGLVFVLRGNPFLRVGGAKILEPTRVSRIWRVSTSTIERPLAFAFCVGKRRHAAHHYKLDFNNSIHVSS